MSRTRDLRGHLLHTVIFLVFFFFFFFFENFFFSQNAYTVELQWPEHLWNHEKMFEIVVVRANEC